MVKFIAASLFTATLVAATPSFALARLVTSCATTDGQYSVAVSDNQGISTVRTSKLIVAITDASGSTVASVEVKSENPTVARSASFGHETLVDSKTSGQKLVFDFASTNTPAAIKAVLNDGSELSSELVCSAN